MQSNELPYLSCAENEKVKFKDVKNFPATFWFLCICTMAYYGSIFPFVSLAQGFFKKEFEFDESEANFITGVFIIIRHFYLKYCCFIRIGLLGVGHSFAIFWVPD